MREFLDLAARMQIRPEVQVYPLEQANQALIDLKFSSIRGGQGVADRAGFLSFCGTLRMCLSGFELQYSLTAGCSDWEQVLMPVPQGAVGVIFLVQNEPGGGLHF